MKNFIAAQLPLVAFLIFYVVIGLFIYKDFGISADEKVEYFAAKHLQHYYLNTTSTNNYPVDIRHLPENSTYFRGHLALFWFLNPQGYYEWFHLLNYLFAALLFIAIYNLIFYVYQNKLYAFLACLIIFNTPRIFGHLFINPKDMPFLVFYFLTSTLIFYFLTSNKTNKALLTAIGISLAISTSFRAIGINLIFIFYIFYYLKTYNFKQTLKYTSFVLLITLIVMLCIFPITINNFPKGFINIFINAQKFSYWNNTKLYFGEYLNNTQNPYSYIFIWSFITLPILNLFLFFCSFKIILKNTLVSYLASILLLNTIFFVVLKPTIYNAERHFLYFFVFIILLIAILCFELIQKNFKFIVLPICIIVINFFYLYKWHPYQYMYFNNIIFYQNNFETDYWGLSYKQAVQALTTKKEFSTINEPKVYACNVDFAVQYYAKGSFEIANKSQNAHFVLCDIDNYNNSKFKNNKQFTIVDTVKINDLPINYILQNNDLLK